MTEKNNSIKCNICGETDDDKFYPNRGKIYCKKCISLKNKEKRIIVSREKEDFLFSAGKKCTRCGEQKKLSEFGIDNRLKYKRSSNCAECKKELSRNYHRDNIEIARESGQKWRDENREYERERGRNYHAKNKEKIAEYAKLYRDKNREYFRMKSMERSAKKILAMPRWANNKYILLWYKLAKIEEERTGIKINVDHVIPLVSNIVCGLHCEDNMQLLTELENKSKGNRYWPDMPDKLCQ